MRTHDIEFFVGFPEPEDFELIMMIDVVEHVEDCWKIVRDATIVRHTSSYIFHLS